MPDAPMASELPAVDAVTMCEYISEYIMPTTIHIPPEILDAVDRKARHLGISRNRLIMQAIERELAPSAGWTPGFFDVLADVTPATVTAVDEMTEAVRSGRRSRKPVSF